MLKTRVKTKFRGLVWVHQKYIGAVMQENETLVIVHDGAEMTITKQSLTENPPVRGEETFYEQWGKEKGQRYRLFGLKFEADQPNLFA